MVQLDRLDVDRFTGQLAVPVVDPVEVAESENAVAHAPPGEIHHRIADVAELEVQQRGEVTVVMVELPGVPDDRRLATRAVRLVAVEPAEPELEERIGVVLLRAVGGFHAAHAEQAGPRRSTRALDAGIDERRDVEAVQMGKRLDVLVDDRVALSVGRLGEVGATGDAGHDVGAGLVDPPEHARDRHVAFGEQLLEAHLVIERERQGRVGALTAHHDLDHLTIALDVGDPHGPPPGLALDTPHRAAEALLEPSRDRRSGVGAG